MTEVAITITAREGKAAAEQIPAVFYGPKEEAMPIALDARDFEKLWKDAGESTIVTLQGVGDDKEALIHDVQWHPLTDEAIHVDFYVIERGKKISVNVPLEFVGEAPAEKENGVVNKIMHELEIEVRPSELPQHIEVNLGKLEKIDSVITVADLALPESAELQVEKDATVASMSVAQEEDLDAPVGDAMPEEMQEEAQEEASETDKKEDE